MSVPNAESPNTSPLTHFDAAGQAHMVDVAAKAETHRVARATGVIRMLPATLALIESGGAKKGDVLGVARIAAIQAAKPNVRPCPALPPAADHAGYRRLRDRPHDQQRPLHRASRNAGPHRRRNGSPHCRADRPAHHLRHGQGGGQGMVMGDVKVLEKRGGKSGEWVAAQ